MLTTPLSVQLVANANLTQVNKYFAAFGLNNGLVHFILHLLSPKWVKPPPYIAEDEPRLIFDNQPKNSSVSILY